MHYELWFMDGESNDRGWRWPRSHGTVQELAATFASLQRRINAGELIADVELLPYEVGESKFDQTARVKFVRVDDDGTNYNLTATERAELDTELRKLGMLGLSGEDPPR